MIIIGIIAYHFQAGRNYYEIGWGARLGVRLYP